MIGKKSCTSRCLNMCCVDTSKLIPRMTVSGEFMIYVQLANYVIENNSSYKLAVTRQH